MGFRRDTAFYSSPAYTDRFDRICAMQHADKFLGCEDMHLVTLGDRTLIFTACLTTPSDRARAFSEMRPSDTARRAATNAPAPADKIFRWDLDSDDVAELSLSGFTRDGGGGGGGGAAFHGLDINQLPDGTLSLYIVNHALSGSSIEKFTHDPSTTVLTHTATIPVAAEHLNPNDIYAVPHLDHVNAFYLTSDHHYSTGPLRTFEDYARRPWGSVHYHADAVWRVALPHVAGANGITGDKKSPGRIYISALLEGSIIVADEDNGVVTEVQRVPLGFTGDNVALTAEGTDVYVAGHAQPQLLGRHVREGDSGPAAGSMVARIGTAQLGSAFFGGGFTAVPSVEEVLVDVSGRWVNASSTAVFRARGGAGAEEEGDLYVTGLTGKGELCPLWRVWRRGLMCGGVGILKCTNFK